MTRSEETYDLLNTLFNVPKHVYAMFITLSDKHKLWYLDKHQKVIDETMLSEFILKRINIENSDMYELEVFFSKHDINMFYPGTFYFYNVDDVTMKEILPIAKSIFNTRSGILYKLTCT